VTRRGVAAGWRTAVKFLKFVMSEEEKRLC